MENREGGYDLDFYKGQMNEDSGGEDYNDYEP